MNQKPSQSLKILGSLKILCLIVLLGLTGCYSVTIDGRWMEGPISLSGRPDRPHLRHFRVQATSHHLIYGLVEFSKADIAAEIMKEVRAAGGTGAVNVTLKTEFGIIDLLLNAITAGIYNPMTVIAEGDVIATE